MIEMMGGKKTFAVIRAVYEHRFSPEDFVRELDFVLEKNVNVVVIEPDDLGEVTWRWIHTGNWLHKTAVLSGLAAIGGTFLTFFLRHPSDTIVRNSLTGISRSLLPSVFFGFVSATSAGLYALFWQCDPCSKYQVARSLSALPACVVAAASGSPSNSSNFTPTLGEEEDVSPSSSPNRHRNNRQSSRNPYPNTVEACTNNGGSPVVLIRRNDFYRKVLHNSVSISAVLCVGLAMYRLR
nr:transmembrane protein 11 mitochondrial [Hymenolepis microstoma]